MSSFPITLVFSDGASRRFDAEAGSSIVAAASEAGLNLLTDCCDGKCGTCAGQLVSGDIELGTYDRAVLTDADRQAGQILTCISRVCAPCVVELPYDSTEATAEELPPVRGTVARVERVAEETMRLEIEVDEPVSFEPGQYVRLKPQGASETRSYSMANLPGEKRLVFFIRLVEGGAFSTWLKTAAAPGAAIEVSAPHGSFFIRDEARPRLFVAGGTGLAPFLSMLETLAGDDAMRRHRTTLLLGVRTGQHLFAVDQLAALKQKWPELDFRFAAESSPAEGCHTGFATELIDKLAIEPNTRVYLCGPPPMVEAGQNAAASVGVPRTEMLCERFN